LLARRAPCYGGPLESGQPSVSEAANASPSPHEVRAGRSTVARATTALPDLSTAVDNCVCNLNP
jgi:hypothetical protein